MTTTADPAARQRAVQRATIERAIYLARLPVIVKQLREQRGRMP